VGDEFYERLNSGLAGLRPSRWLRAPAEQTGAALQSSVAAGTGDWPPLRALLCGLALTAPPGYTESETAKLARATLPDIQDSYVTALAEAGQAAKLLADRGLSPGTGHPANGCRGRGVRVGAGRDGRMAARRRTRRRDGAVACDIDLDRMARVIGIELDRPAAAERPSSAE
jgi:hypothetical protein